MAEEKEQKLDYYEGVGRRKTATARVRIWPEKKYEFTVNGKKLEDFFSSEGLIKKAKSPLEMFNIDSKFGITVHVKGGGVTGQGEAIRHGLSRALVEYNPDWRPKLSKKGFLTRDPRMKERKKPGLKKARRAPQWGKR